MGNTDLADADGDADEEENNNKPHRRGKANPETKRLKKERKKIEAYNSKQEAAAAGGAPGMRRENRMQLAKLEGERGVRKIDPKRLCKYVDYDSVHEAAHDEFAGEFARVQNYGEDEF